MRIDLENLRSWCLCGCNSVELKARWSLCMTWKPVGLADIAQLILNLGRVVSFMSRPLDARWKDPLYPLNNWLSGFQSQYWSFGEDVNFLLLPGVRLRLLGRPARNPVTIQGGVAAKHILFAGYVPWLCVLHWFLYCMDHVRTYLSIVRFEQFAIWHGFAHLTVFRNYILPFCCLIDDFYTSSRLIIMFFPNLYLRTRLSHKLSSWRRVSTSGDWKNSIRKLR